MAEVKYLDLTGLQRYDQKIKEVVNTGLDSKIGKDDVMIEVPSISTSKHLQQDSTINIPACNNWDCQIKASWTYPIKMEVYDNNNVLVWSLDGNANVEQVNMAPGGGSLSIVKCFGDEDFDTEFVSMNTSEGLIVKYTQEMGADVLINKYDASYFNTQESLTYLNDTKVNKATVDVALNNKADKAEVKSSLALKADKTEVESSLALKADKTEVESSLEHLNSTLSTKITAEDLPTAVSQLSNDAGYAVAGDLKIAEVTEGLGENVAKAYKFEGGAESAVIEIPKDQTLKSVELGKYATEGDTTSFVVDPTGEILRFTYIIADGSESVVDVNISNLITEAELDPVYAAIDEKVASADIVKVTNEEIDAMFA